MVSFFTNNGIIVYVDRRLYRAKSVYDSLNIWQNQIIDQRIDLNEGADRGRYIVFVRDFVAADNPGAQAGQIRDVVLSAPVG